MSGSRDVPAFQPIARDAARPGDRESYLGHHDAVFVLIRQNNALYIIIFEDYSRQVL